MNTNNGTIYLEMKAIANITNINPNKIIKKYPIIFTTILKHLDISPFMTTRKGHFMLYFIII